MDDKPAMPENNLRRRKNRLVLGLLIAWVILIFGVTVIKIRENRPENQAVNQDN